MAAGGVGITNAGDGDAVGEGVPVGLAPMVGDAVAVEAIGLVAAGVAGVPVGGLDAHPAIRHVRSRATTRLGRRPVNDETSTRHLRPVETAVAASCGAGQPCHALRALRADRVTVGGPAEGGPSAGCPSQCSPTSRHHGTTATRRS
jgi:hypothetical protein